MYYIIIEMFTFGDATMRGT